MKNLTFLLLLLYGPLVHAQQFSFTAEKPGFRKVSFSEKYRAEKGYGFEPNAAAGPDSVVSFSVKLPEGNYDVLVGFGAGQQGIRAESRRLLLPETPLAAGTEKTVTVNLRSRRVNDSVQVRLKPRELNYLHWDDKLTLTFFGKNIQVSYLTISPSQNPVTVFLAGNSTVTDQPSEPYASWGQMIPAFFQPQKVVVANLAESGEALKSFRAEKRFDKLLSLLRPGDYVLVEFAHNDQKPGSSHVEPFTTYKEQLSFYIDETRRRGGIPVLVTSMHRRAFDSTGHLVNTLGDYPEAARQTGRERGVAVLDLNARSRSLFEALGPETSKKAFVHYPAGRFAGQTQPLADDTHFSTYGAWELARCIVEELKASNLPLKNLLLPGLPAFDPARPDACLLYTSPSPRD